MTAHAPHTSRRRAREEESPPTLAPRHLRAPLEVEHLADRHAPEREEGLVHHVGLGRGPALEGGGVGGDGGEVGVVEPGLREEVR